MLWLWIILCGAAVFSVISWVAYEIYNRHILRLCRAIPSAQPCYALLGNIPSFVCSVEKITENLFQIIQESVLSGHRAVCFWFCAYPIVLIVDPDDIKKVLNSSLNRGQIFEESGQYFTKYGLLMSPVDHWKVTRRRLNLSFHPSNLKQLMPVFISSSRQLVEDLSGFVGGGAFDLKPHVISAALRNICVLIYGPRILEQMSSENFEDLRRAVDQAVQLMALRITLPWLQNDTICKVLYGREIDSLKKTLYNIMQVSNQSYIYEEHVSRKYVKDGFQTILNAMYDLKSRFSYITDQHVTDEIISFFGGGADTMGSSVSSCLLALACFPKMQDKVYEEICSVVLDKEEITYEDLNKLTYLDQVIKETLRFFTVIPFSIRAPNKDVHLEGYTIPANKTTLLCLAAASIDSKYFDDPHSFDPDRFSTPSRTEYGDFMPFSRGPRNCIGKDYALIFMKMMVAQVLRKYELSAKTDIYKLKKKFMITLTSSEGYHVFLNNRDK